MCRLASTLSCPHMELSSELRYHVTSHFITVTIDTILSEIKILSIFLPIVSEHKNEKDINRILMRKSRGELFQSYFTHYEQFVRLDLQNEVFSKYILYAYDNNFSFTNSYF